MTLDTYIKKQIHTVTHIILKIRSILYKRNIKGYVFYMYTYTVI